MDLSLIISAFVAGIFTFLAPCTLPLVPGYLGFISGTSIEDLKNPQKAKHARKKVFFNGLLYVIGFSFVFVILGTVFSLAGLAVAGLRIWLARIGGIIIIIFGLHMMHVLKLPFLNFLNQQKKFNIGNKLKPGKPSSSFLLGMTFAFGWTPCVGPVLGSVLLLASAKATVLQGGFLLLIFSAGLAIPFLLIALAIGHAAQYVQKITKYLNVISIIGGLFLVFIGVLLLTNSMAIWFAWAYEALEFINYDGIYDFL